MALATIGCPTTSAEFPFVGPALIQEARCATEFVFREAADGAGLELLSSSELVADQVAGGRADVVVDQRTIRIGAGCAALPQDGTPLGIDALV